LKWKRDDDGKPQYAAIVKWRSRDLADRFSDAVVTLVAAQHPDIVDRLKTLYDAANRDNMP
jgi:hypothetical protein